ncbi:GNAT family N-acetyltransferase [Nocardia alni]|uniref:GNAT family N-acetyltransferase n=1 Tax=Nocardia alni TaxID=2815723 RepID=UPI001C229BB6|nr:GNAT family protein [Nocardia alni]
MSGGRLDRVVLGPARLPGGSVVIRPPRPADHASWRAIRLRDRALIEPFWYSSTLDWPLRHTESQWVREVLLALAEARAGRRLAGVIEVNGRFAGQCELCGIDRHGGTAEMSIWIDAGLARHGFGGLAAALVADYGFGALGLHRIVAPISPENTAAAAGAAQLGFVREALMARYFDAGGARRDHALWALIRTRIPPGGFVAQWTRRSGTEHGSRQHDPHITGRPCAPIPAASPPAPCDTDEAIAPEPARSPKRSVKLVLVAGRLAIGDLYHRIPRWRATRTVRLNLPGHPRAVLRTRRRSDGPGWRRSRIRNHALLDGVIPSAQWARRHSRTAWWREFSLSRAGLRSPGGLVLVLEIDGDYCGEARLFDLDMFDRNARLFLWADPTRAGVDIRAAAIRAVLHHAFDRLGLYRVAAEIETTDIESTTAAAHAGLLKEGTMRDHRGPTGHRSDHALWALTIGERE